MPSQDLPSTMRAWQYSTTSGGLENNMHLNTSAPIPKPKPDQHLVRVLAASLNPADFKPAEMPLVTRFAMSKPATPGLDIVGHVVEPAAGSDLKAGQLVFGQSGTTLFAGAALADYAIAQKDSIAAVPEGVSLVDASTINICGATAYVSIIPHNLKPGQRVFINGGSGGTGVYGIAIAKIAGLHVTTSCSSTNVELCKSLGADVVLDYKKKPILEQLKAQPAFDHVIDNMGYDYDFFWKAHTYTTPSAKYVFVGVAPSLGFFSFVFKTKIIPGFLGGAKRKLDLQITEIKVDQLKQIAKWMSEGKVKVPIDEVFPFDKAAEAMRKLKTGRAKGKIVVDVDLKSHAS